MGVDESSGGRWDGFLSPRAWIPLAVVVVAAVAALGVLLAMKWDNDGAVTNIVSCDPADEGCELRQNIHWHADFSVVVNGEPVDFSADRYISSEEQPISPKAHIHDPRHTVVHVHLEQTTWAEFFQTMDIKLGDGVFTMDDGTQYVSNDTEKWQYVKNGVLVDTLRYEEISDLDRVLFIYGDETPEEALAAWLDVSDEACIPSAICTDRGLPENEPCGGLGTECN